MREELDFEECLNEVNNDPYIEINPLTNLFNHFKVIVRGLHNTVYRDGVFVFEIINPRDYPLKPPYIYCHTKIWHPNIDNKIPMGRPNTYLNLINPALIGFIGGWVPGKTLLNVIRSIKKLIHMEKPIFNLEYVFNFKVRRQIIESPNNFERIAREWTRLYANENQEITLAPMEEIENYFNYAYFKFDLDTQIGDLKNNFSKLDLLRPVSIQFICRGRVLPDNATFRNLGIDPRSNRITIMRTYAYQERR
ncbi:MAG: ubiquitin-conjugating enzyme E2 [Candidatus Helarchaeota archaeon]